MKIKTIIRLVDYSQSVLVFSLFAFVIAFSRKAGDGVFIALEFGVGLAGVILFLFRSVIINRLMLRNPHPGLLYAVFDKLGMTQKMDLSLSDELLDEVYRPTYSTAEFLSENNLRTEFNGDSGIVFLDKGLSINSDVIPWTKIYDWTYTPQGRGSSGKIIVSYYDKDQNIQEATIEILGFSMNKIDLLLLLTHFKGKYGQAG